MEDYFVAKHQSGLARYERPFSHQGFQFGNSPAVFDTHLYALVE